MSAHQHPGRGGGDGDEPANITRAEWDRYRGIVYRTGSMVDNLVSQLKQTTASLELVRIEMKSLRVAINEFKRGVSERLDKHSDWRDTAARHELEEKDRHIEKLEEKEEKRIALWMKIALGILAAVAEAAILHWLKF